MTWKEAKLYELVVVLFDDYATTADKLDAENEIKRRMKRKYARLMCKQVSHYPK